MRLIACRRCGRTREHKARLLCQGCYDTVRFDGTLFDYPPVTRPMDEFVVDFRVLSGRGMTHAEIAGAMGYSGKKSLERIVCRARKAGLLPEAVRR